MLKKTITRPPKQRLQPPFQPQSCPLDEPLTEIWLHPRSVSVLEELLGDG